MHQEIFFIVTVVIAKAIITIEILSLSAAIKVSLIKVFTITFFPIPITSKKLIIDLSSIIKQIYWQITIKVLARLGVSKLEAATLFILDVLLKSTLAWVLISLYWKVVFIIAIKLPVVFIVELALRNSYCLLNYHQLHSFPH